MLQPAPEAFLITSKTQTYQNPQNRDKIKKPHFAAFKLSTV